MGLTGVDDIGLAAARQVDQAAGWKWVLLRKLAGPCNGQAHPTAKSSARCTRSDHRGGTHLVGQLPDVHAVAPPTPAPSVSTSSSSVPGSSEIAGSRSSSARAAGK